MLFSPAGAWWTVLTAMVLGLAAATDWCERRVPRRAMSVGAAAVALVIVTACGSRGEWMTLSRSGIAAVLVLTGLGRLWWTRPKLIGLGDVKAVGLAFASAAAVSWQAVSNVMWRPRLLA